MTISTSTLDVEVVSQETVKPSSPTPQHLRNYKLSFIDQLWPYDHIPVILFYPSLQYSNGASPETLRNSLSRTLTRFFPLAGRLSEDLSAVDCSDQGADFFLARAHTHLPHFLRHPREGLLPRLLPCQQHASCTQKPGRGILLSVQITTFDCGGMAVAVCVAHKVSDGISMAAFLNAWAAETRSSITHPAPDLTAPTLFLPIDGGVPASTSFEPASVHKLVVRRFVFDEPSITKLRSKAAGAYCRPSRVEAVTALLWRCIVRARANVLLETAKSPAMAVHFIDLRRRMAPSLPQTAFGNICTVAVMSVAAATGGGNVVDGEFEQQMRSSVMRVDAEYARQLQGPEGAMWAMEALGEAFGMGEDVGPMDKYMFSSWCGFPLYAVDFGWGKPAWVTPVGEPSDAQKNNVVLMDTKTSGGMEAWLTLEEKEIQELQRDELLRSAATVHSPAGGGESDSVF